jgi:sterol desaturase/sphingolipid hydroxylase (fatty acid hydroxylase superfamily)
MAFDQFTETIVETDEDARSYLKHSEAYLELKVFKILMRLVTTFFQTVLVGSMLLLALFIISIAFSYGIGQALGNTWYGFAIVSVFFMLLALLFYVLRKQINKPIIRFFSTHYFNTL